MRVERPDREPDLAFQVLGHSWPAGSKDTGVVYRTDKTTGAKVPVVDEKGRIRTFVRDSSGKKGDQWRAQVAIAGQRAMDGRKRFESPLYVELTIVRARNKDHFGTGRNAGVLKASAPLFPNVMPDVIKLTRGTEDALTGVVWRDDSSNIVMHVEKVYAQEGEPAGALIRIWTLPATVGHVQADEQLSLGAVA